MIKKWANIWKTLSVNLKCTFLKFCHMNLADFLELFLPLIFLLDMQQLSSLLVRPKFMPDLHMFVIILQSLDIYFENFRKPGRFLFLIHHYYTSLVFDQKFYSISLFCTIIWLSNFHSIDLHQDCIIHICVKGTWSHFFLKIYFSFLCLNA